MVTNDESQIKQLIQWATAKRDWFLVEKLFNDLGAIYENDWTTI